MSISTQNVMRTTYNVHGVIEGATEPDRYVLLGNHRDSWVFGATDPSGGTAAVMEVSRAMGVMLKRGNYNKHTKYYYKIMVVDKLLDMCH